MASKKDSEQDWVDIIDPLEKVDVATPATAKTWNPSGQTLHIPASLPSMTELSEGVFAGLGDIFDSSPNTGFEILLSVVISQPRDGDLTMRGHIENMAKDVGFIINTIPNPLQKVEAAGEAVSNYTCLIPRSSTGSPGTQISGQPSSSPWTEWFKFCIESTDKADYMKVLDGLFCTLCLLIKFDVNKFLDYVKNKLPDIAGSVGCIVLGKIPTSKDFFESIKSLLSPGNQLMTRVYAVLVSGFVRPETSGVFNALGVLRLSGYGTITVQLCIQVCLTLNMSITSYFKAIMCNSFVASARAIRSYLLILHDPKGGEHWKSAILLARILEVGYFNNLSLKKHPKFNYLSAKVISNGGTNLSLAELSVPEIDRRTLDALASILHEKFGSISSSTYSSESVAAAVKRSAIKYSEGAVNDTYQPKTVVPKVDYN